MSEPGCHELAMKGETYRLLEVGDEVVAVLVLLETSERHLGTRNVLEERANRQKSAF